MNGKQRTVLVAAIAAVAAMLLFPPFYAKLPTGLVENLGYGLIFYPPVFELRYPSRAELTGSVDVVVLLAQWLAVLIIGAIAYALFRD